MRLTLPGRVRLTGRGVDWAACASRADRAKSVRATAMSTTALRRSDNRPECWERMRRASPQPPRTLAAHSMAGVLSRASSEEFRTVLVLSLAGSVRGEKALVGRNTNDRTKPQAFCGVRAKREGCDPRLRSGNTTGTVRHSRLVAGRNRASHPLTDLLDAT